jgi:neopullulanase
MKKIILFLLITTFSFAQIERVEPPNWWIGFQNNQLQLLVKENNIANANPSINYEGVSIVKVTKGNSNNYLFLDLKIDKNTKPGTFEIIFTPTKGKKKTHSYSLFKRENNASEIIGFDNSDAIYLITPDRFSNANSKNDSFENLNEKGIDRKNDYARHGGDIEGIKNHLDYIKNLGFTTVWPTPMLTNDMKNSSYHGYAITDYYQVDPRFGTLQEYKNLATEMHKKDMKLIMDHVANHCGLEHWWMKDLPFKDWINYQEKFENKEKIPFSNHKRTTNQDLYASQSDKKEMADGWFVDAMPDLNQKNPFMANYIIQNSIWWIETLQLNGIRQDTYPYPDKEFMANWTGAIMNEYPNFNIVGEEWSTNPLLIAYWQKNHKNKDGYASNLKSTMDFAMQKNIVEALNEEESWDKGLIKMYEGLANDFSYENPNNIMIFPDNHDMSRIFTQLKGDITNTKMALSYLLTLPRTPQIYYGTEILMNDFAKPGDHGLIRTDFPGGWQNDAINAFTQEGLTAAQMDMQNFLTKTLNYRKNSKAIQNGKTIHFGPNNGVYLLSRIDENETVIHIINKNELPITLDLERFKELNLEGKKLRNILSDTTFIWEKEMVLQAKGSYIFSTKL